MKRFFAILWAVALFFPLFSLDAKAELYQPVFAIIGDEAILYRKTDAAYLPVCTLPSGYFVRVDGESENGFVPVTYDDLSGFVPTSTITACEKEPISKYHSTMITLSNDGHSVNLRSEPSHERDNVISTLPSESCVHYYGATTGSTQVEAVGANWFYVRFDDGGEKKRGFVYSLYCSTPQIDENYTEWVTEPEPPVTDDVISVDGTTSDENDATEKAAKPLSSIKEGVIIAALCLPTILIVYILFKKPLRKA